MKNSLSITLLLLCACVSQTTIAQKRKQAQDSTVVITFQEIKPVGATKKKGSSESNVIKIAPLGFINGTFPLYYERRLADFFTLQVGGGLTSRNYMRGVWVDGLSEIAETKYPWDADGYGDEADPLYDFSNRTARLGHLFSVEPRLYFESEAPEGLYLGLGYNKMRYNFQIPALVSTSNGNREHKGKPVDEYENVSDMMANFGGQSIYDRLSFEYAVGIGLRNVRGSKYARYQDGNSYVEGPTAYKDSKINFTIGLRVGYHF